MNYKMICIDLDGTLLNGCKQITPVTLESLRLASKLGVQVVINTGRNFTEASYFSDLIGIDAPLITANGAYIKAKGTAQPISHSPLGANLVVKLYELCLRYQIAYCFYTPQNEYYGNDFSRMFSLSAWHHDHKPERLAVGKKYIFTKMRWDRLIAEKKERILKCVVRSNDCDKLDRFRQELLKSGELETASSGAGNIEITRKGVSKGQGVAILAQHFGLQRSEIIAIGDNENDLAMIEYAGLGVAMGNAVDQVKQKANAVTASNEEDGVGQVVQKYVLTI